MADEGGIVVAGLAETCPSRIDLVNVVGVEIWLPRKR
jgi:hypothetical protein